VNPDTLGAGPEFPPAIEEKLKRCDRVIVALSAKSLESEWVQREVELALQREFERQRDSGDTRPVLLPLRLDDAVLQTGKYYLADKLKHREIADFTGWEDETQYLAALGSLLRVR
jgi:hypothetical protein